MALQPPRAAGAGIDAQTYAEAVERLQPALRRWALRNAAADDADDLVAEVLTALWARRHTRNPELGELDDWVWGIARIELSRHRRTAGRATSTPDVPDERDEPSAEDSALLNIAAAAGIALVAGGIAALSETDYSVITDAAATYLGVTRGGAAIPLDAAARVRLHRIRGRLSRHLDG